MPHFPRGRKDPYCAIKMCYYFVVPSYLLSPSSPPPLFFFIISFYSSSRACFGLMQKGEYFSSNFNYVTSAAFS